MDIQRFRSRSSEAAVAGALLKVPEITAYFWIVKLLSTTMGEATSDYFVLDVNRYLGVVLGFVGQAERTTPRRQQLHMLRRRFDSLCPSANS